jgi:hypothetical protein
VVAARFMSGLLGRSQRGVDSHISALGDHQPESGRGPACRRRWMAQRAGRRNLFGNNPDLDIRHHIFRREFAILILRIHP